MPNGSLAEAFAVPVQRTQLPRPAVSDLQPRRKAAAPVGPEEVEFPEDIITGQPITQKLSEAWMDLQNFVGSTWATYGINIQKPDPSSPAQGELFRRYTEKLNKVQMLGATAQRAKEIQDYQIRGKIQQGWGGTTPGLEKVQFLANEEFDALISDANQEWHKFFSTGNFKEAENLKNQRSQYIDDRVDFLVKGGLDPEQGEFAKRQFKLRLENNYIDFKSRAQIGLARTKEARAKEEFLTFNELHRDISEEFDPAGYTEKEELDISAFKLPEKHRQKVPLFSGQPLKRTGFLIGTPLSRKEMGQREFDGKMVRADVTPLVEAQVLSKDGKHIYLIFDDGSTQIMTLKELEKRHIDYSGKYGTSEAGKLRGALAKFYKEGEKEVPTTEKEKVPSASMENWIARGWSEEQAIRAEKLGKIKITK